MRWILAGLSGLLASAAVLAAPPVNKPTGAKSALQTEAVKSRRPVELVCDRMEVFHRKRTALCSGRVTLKRGPMLLSCDKLEARYGESGEIDKAVCTGHVHFFLPPRAGEDEEGSEPKEAGGERADYSAEPEVLALAGKPWMRQGESVVRGSRIVYDLSEDRMVVEQARGRLKLDRKPETEPDR